MNKANIEKVRWILKRIDEEDYQVRWYLGKVKEDGEDRYADEQLKEHKQNLKYFEEYFELLK